MTHHSNRIFRHWFLIEYLKESVRNRNSRQWRVHSYEKYDFKYLLYFTWPLIWLFTPFFEISKQAHYGPKRPPKIAEVRSISLQKHKGLSINYVIDFLDILPNFLLKPFWIGWDPPPFRQKIQKNLSFFCGWGWLMLWMWMKLMDDWYCGSAKRRWKEG